MGFISRILVLRLDMLLYSKYKYGWFQRKFDGDGTSITFPPSATESSPTLPPRAQITSFFLNLVLVHLNSLKLLKSSSVSLFHYNSTSPPIWIQWLIFLFQKIPLVMSERRPGDAEIVYASTHKAEKELNWKYVSLLFNGFLYRLFMYTFHLLFPICHVKWV